MHILVTGSSGYIGQALVPYLLEHGYSVSGIDIGWFGQANQQINLPNFTLKNVNEIAADDLRDVDVIIHLAAVANDPSGELDSKLTWETNVLFTNSLISAAVAAGVKRFIFASSGSVYGVQDVEKVTENVNPVPLSDYNKTKLIGERVIASYGADIGLQIVRPGTVCGVSSRPRFDVVVNLLTEQAFSKRRLTVFGGDQIRPHIHIADMCSVYSFLLERPHLSGVFNASFENMSVKALAERIAEKVGVPIDFEASDDPRSYRMSSDKIRNAGFWPEYTVDDAIDELLAALQNGKIKNSNDAYNVKWMKENII